MDLTVKNFLVKMLALTIPVTLSLAQNNRAFAADVLIANIEAPRKSSVAPASSRGRWSSKGGWWLSRTGWRPASRTTPNRRYSPAGRRLHTGKATVPPGPEGNSPNQAKAVTGGDQAAGLSSDRPPKLSAPALKTGSASLSWTAPVARADGSALALSEISGYTVYYGPGAENLPHSIDVNDASATSLTINNLPAGTCYMVVTARDTQGRESGPSNLVAKQVP